MKSEIWPTAFQGQNGVLIGAQASKRFWSDAVNWFTTLERLAAVILLVLSSPILLLVALAVKVTSPGDFIFRQKRVGYCGKVFTILKFRTMVVSAEAGTGPVLSWNGDPRITPIGCFLRKTHLDELPQLINVVRGEMAFIGPRPERPEFVNEFIKVVPNYMRRQNVLPGITGLAQISAGYDAKPQEKLVYDLHFIERRGSVVLRAAIIWRTVLKLFGLLRINNNVTPLILRSE